MKVADLNVKVNFGFSDAQKTLDYLLSQIEDSQLVNNITVSPISVDIDSRIEAKLKEAIRPGGILWSAVNSR